MAVSDLMVTIRVVSIRLLGRQFVEHGVEEHVKPSIGLDSLPQGVHTRVQLLITLGVTGLDGILKPFSKNVLILWEPISYSENHYEQDAVTAVEQVYVPPHFLLLGNGCHGGYLRC
jgi:hypothetical protein